MIENRLNKKILIKILLFIVVFIQIFSALALSTNGFVKAESPTEIVSTDGWKFYRKNAGTEFYLADQNSYKDVKVIVAAKGNQVVVFPGFQPGANNNVFAYRQADPVFKEGFCRAYIQEVGLDSSGNGGVPYVIWPAWDGYQEGNSFSDNSYCPPNNDKDIESFLAIGGVREDGSQPNKPANTAAFQISIEPTIPPEIQAIIDAEINKQQESTIPPEDRTPPEDLGCAKALTPVGWILCSVIPLANGIYEFFVNQVNNLLFFESGRYDNDQIKLSWNIFTDIANSLLVIIGLIIIISQIFNFEFISAYTVKKALPRLVIGVILIQLSWYMFTLIIQIVNAIGSGIYDLLLVPFNETGDFVNVNTILFSGENQNSAEFGWNALGTVLIVGVGVGAILTGAWLSIIVVLLGALISILVALLVIILREGLLTILLVISPIALALWILPGTNKYWKMWWDNYLKLLLMYPLIMLLFAAGAISSIILSRAEISFNMFFALIAYFAPLFLIGATFKLAGNFMGSLSGLSGKLGSKAKNSGMFGLRDRAKFTKENSVLGQRKKLNEYQRQRNAYERVGKYMGNDRSLKGRIATLGLNKNTKSYAQAMAYGQLNELEEKDKKAEIARIQNSEDFITKDFKQKQAWLANEALKGGTRGSAAMDLIVDMRMSGALDQIAATDAGKAELSKYENKNSKVAGYIYENRRDLNNLYDANAASGMAPNDLLTQKDDFWKASNPHRESLNTGALRSLYESDRFATLGPEAKNYIQSRISEDLAREGRTFNMNGAGAESRTVATSNNSPGQPSLSLTGRERGSKVRKIRNRSN